MAMRDGRNIVINVAQTQRYVHVFHREGEECPLVDVNFFDGEDNDPEELGRMAEALIQAKHIVEQWRVEDLGPKKAQPSLNIERRATR